MHSAPAVRYPVARSSRAGACLLAAWALAGGTSLWWGLHGGATTWSLGVAMALSVLGASVAFLQWRGMPAGVLRWDGQAWWWLRAVGADECAVSVRVRLDLQQGILLHVAGLPGRARWCYLEQSAAPARWSDLRRALYSPRSFDSVPGQGAVLPP